IRNDPLARCTVNTFAPGPVIVRFLSSSSSPDVRLIVYGPPPGAKTVGSKLIVSVEQASAIAWRSEPAPLSAMVVTTRFAGHVTTETVLSVLADAALRLPSTSVAALA